MSDKSNNKADPLPLASAISMGRRAALKRLAWAAPAVVATTALRARAAKATCPGCPPEDE